MKRQKSGRPKKIFYQTSGNDCSLDKKILKRRIDVFCLFFILSSAFDVMMCILSGILLDTWLRNSLTSVWLFFRNSVISNRGSKYVCVIERLSIAIGNCSRCKDGDEKVVEIYFRKSGAFWEKVVLQDYTFQFIAKLNSEYMSSLNSKKSFQNLSIFGKDWISNLALGWARVLRVYRTKS